MTRTEAKIKLTNLTIQIETEMREPVTSERARVIAKLITERAGVISDMRQAKVSALAQPLTAMRCEATPSTASGALVHQGTRA
jgi:hypothetical protein